MNIAAFGLVLLPLVLPGAGQVVAQELNTSQGLGSQDRGLGLARERAAQSLKMGLAQKSAGEVRFKLLSEAGRKAVDALGSTDDQSASGAGARLNSAKLLAELLDRSVERHAADADLALRWLEPRLKGFVEDFEFEPLMQAQRPEGYPAVTPVLEIELKQMPVVRLARTSMEQDSSAGRRGDNGSFWTLFQHIQSNKIEMTAPVEMTYGGGDSDLRAVAMAFLYDSVRRGELMQQGDVEVLDVPATWVVSLGCRGRMSDRTVARHHQELLAWIAGRKDLKVVGALRSLGYNSPMVPNSRTYFEVQLPVKPIAIGEPDVDERAQPKAKRKI